MDTPSPGFEFRPYDDELVGYFLRHKILGNTSLVEAFIAEVNICDFDPWHLRLLSKVISRDLVWYFFSKRENKYASGNQQSRTTPSGFWKLTGDPVDVKDQRMFWCRNRGGKIGYKRVLVFQKGRNSRSKGTKSDWVMHELHNTLLLPEQHQKTYVICRLEYKGDDMDILSYDPTVLTPAFVTPSSGSVVDQTLQAYSGSYNTYPDNDSPNQGHQFGGNFNMDQSLQGNSRSFNNYGSPNQGQQFGGDFHMNNSVQGNVGFSNSPVEYGSVNQGQLFPSDFNMQQQAPFPGLYGEEPEMIWNELWGDQMAYTQENRSNHQPRNPVIGVLADYSSDSDIDSMIGRDTSSSTNSVGSSNGTYHDPVDEIPSLTTIEALHSLEAQHQPKQLKLQLQGKEKVINSQRSECEWKMAKDSVKKAPSTLAVKQSLIVLKEINQRNSQWTYLRNIITGILLFLSVIGWIIVVG